MLWTAPPAAQWTGAHKGHAFFAYADNYLIDLKAAETCPDPSEFNSLRVGSRVAFRLGHNALGKRRADEVEVAN